MRGICNVLYFSRKGEMIIQAKNWSDEVFEHEHDWATSLSQGRGAWWAAVYGVAQSRHDWSNLAAAAACLYWLPLDDPQFFFLLFSVTHILNNLCDSFFVTEV